MAVIRRVAVRLLAAALLLMAAFLTLTPLGRYLARAAWEEAWILARRRSIDGILADSSGATAAERERLRLVTDVRAFAESTLGLAAGASFTTYSRLTRDTLVLVLSAARRDTLAAHTWWFPVVGRFPYKGFFDADDARRAERAMQLRGYDTYLRPAAAFSTLGWFNDPLLSTTLRLDTVSLANTVIHEVTHNTLFVRDAVSFNESFASFVGARGSAEFFRARGASEAARHAEAAWRDDKLLGAFWAATLGALDSAFGAHPGDSVARLVARDTVFGRMRRVLLDDVAPRLRTIPADRLQRVPFDNASLLARRVYAAELWLFDAVHERAGGTLSGTVQLVSRIVRASGGDPFEALRAWLGAPVPSRGGATAAARASVRRPYPAPA